MPKALIRELTKDLAQTSPPAFACQLSGDRALASVYVAGELDGRTAPQLEQLLRAADLRAPLVVLDLRDVTSIDHDGVRVIGYASMRASRARRRLVAIRGLTEVDELFAQAGCTDVVEIVDLDPAVPAIQVLLRLARAEVA